MSEVPKYKTPTKIIMLNEIKKNWLDIATAAILIIIGLSVLSDVGPAFITRVAFMARSVPGTGVVARCDIKHVTPFVTEFTPIAEFTAGNVYEARGETSSATCADAAHNREPTDVRYNPQMPSDAMIGSTTQLLARLTLFTVAGAVAVVVGIIIAIQIWRTWPRSAVKK